MDVKEAFSPIKESKEQKYVFGSLNKSSESLIDITKKLASLVTLLVFIVFNDSFGVKTHIYWI